MIASMNASQRGLLVEGGSGLVMAWRVCGGSFSHLEVSEESTRKVWLVAFAGWVWTHWASVVGVEIPGGMFIVSIVWGAWQVYKYRGVTGEFLDGGYGCFLRVEMGGVFRAVFRPTLGPFMGWLFGLVF